ncbi:MAG: TonB-dependent receptor plug domain-containing protein, partial [Cytophagaceae bacterium]
MKITKGRCLLKSLTICSTFVFASHFTYGQAPTDTLTHRTDTLETERLPQVEIMGKKDGVFGKIPGSANYIPTTEIKKIAPVSGNEVLRRVPGVHVVDEEGAGLRVNIGIRGLDPNRSSSVLMLEDGVPISLNPYGEPEMYYTPSIDRMAGVEVLKGSGQIMYGPQTIGGVINYITPNPPEKEELHLRLRGGQLGYFSGYASYGNTVGKTGFIVNYLHRRADNMGPTWFKTHDLNFKTVT